MSKRHNYTEEEYQFLIDNVKGISLKELTKKFNKKFNTNVTEIAIQCQKNKLKIKSEYSPSWFKKGEEPYNKGVPMTKEQYQKCKNTMFKKGEAPPRTHNIGDEVIDIYGYRYIKIAQPDVWVTKSRYIYEKTYGKLKKNQQVIFADGNKSNFDIDNLIAVKKSEMLIINKNGLYKKNKELTKTGVNIARLINEIYKKEK